MCFLKNILKIFDIFVKMRYYITRDAEVSELADEQDSGSCERIHIVESLKTQRFAEVSELADEQD